MTKAAFMRRHIGRTYLRLAHDLPYSEVTVQRIISECEINRKTFYYHFSNRASLACYVFRFRLADKLRAEMPPGSIAEPVEFADDPYWRFPLYWTGDPDEEGSRYFVVLSHLVAEDGWFYQKMSASPDWEPFQHYLFEAYRPWLMRDLEEMFAREGVQPNEGEMEFLAYYFTNLSVIWIFNRRTLKAARFPRGSAERLHGSVHYAMEGIVRGVAGELGGPAATGGAS